MKIAVDARPLAPPVTGIGVYTGSLLSRLLDGGHEWYLYSDRPLEESAWSARPGVQVRHGSCTPRSLASLLHANWQFARWAVLDGVDVFWSPRHHLPLSMPVAIPAVVTVHDLVWRRFPDTLPWRNRQLERFAMGSALRRARRVIAVSEFTRQELMHFYPGMERKCAVIPEAGRDLGMPAVARESEPYFLFVGTLEPRKNLPTLLRAFAEFLATGDFPHRLLLVGAEGWGEVSLPALARELGVEQRISLRGYVSDSELAALYAGAEALVLPSVYEGFGLPVVEAMSFATPVIVSDRSALPEVAGAGGLLVEPGDLAQLASAMLAVAGDGALRASLSEAARLQASRFSWDAAAENTLAEIVGAASSRSGSGSVV